ncbi:MAG: hypothetical protein COB50_03205 [Thiotrichales bacterium]|nr:MAG: hypothetical protein COB50_03205 [Thiotrichales bacterium]
MSAESELESTTPAIQKRKLVYVSLGNESSSDDSLPSGRFSLMLPNIFCSAVVVFGARIVALTVTGAASAVVVPALIALCSILCSFAMFYVLGGSGKQELDEIFCEKYAETNNEGIPLSTYAAISAVMGAAIFVLLMATGANAAVAAIPFFSLSILSTGLAMCADFRAFNKQAEMLKKVNDEDKQLSKLVDSYCKLGKAASAVVALTGIGSMSAMLVTMFVSVNVALAAAIIIPAFIVASIAAITLHSVFKSKGKEITTYHTASSNIKLEENVIEVDKVV